MPWSMSTGSPYAVLSPMQPSPIAETSRALVPSWRLSMLFLLRRKARRVAGCLMRCGVRLPAASFRRRPDVGEPPRLAPADLHRSAPWARGGIVTHGAAKATDRVRDERVD